MIPVIPVIAAVGAGVGGLFLGKEISGSEENVEKKTEIHIQLISTSAAIILAIAALLIWGVGNG